MFIPARRLSFIPLAAALLAANGAAPFKTVKEFVAAARGKPGTINYASLGSGSTGHLGSGMLTTDERR